MHDMDGSQSSIADAADPSQLEDKVAALTLEQDDNASTKKIQELQSSSSSSISSSIIKAQDVKYRNYRDENDLDVIIDLVAPYLSEPYSVYCYRYFLHGWYVAFFLLSPLPILLLGPTYKMLILFNYFNQASIMYSCKR